METILEELDLKSKIGEAIQLDYPLMNASGCKCTTPDELDALNVTESLGGIVTKTCTLEPRVGNPSPRYWTDGPTSINSMGLPNEGIDNYIDYIISTRTTTSNYKRRKMDRQDVKTKTGFGKSINLYNKPLIISIGGLSLDENMKIINRYLSDNYTYSLTTAFGHQDNLHGHLDGTDIHNVLGAKGLEFNLSCPNIIGKGQLGNDFESFDNYLSKIFETDLSSIKKSDLAIGLKLPPYYELKDFEIVRDILFKYPRLDYITTVNSIANGLIINIDTEKPVIVPKHGIGGIGGNVILPTALSNVFNFNKQLNGKLDIIGCGGVISGRDVFKHILCGASCVSIGTALQNYGTNIFSKVTSELQELMIDKKYKSIGEFKGKLEPLYESV